MVNNKILLFIVEGPSDEQSLAPALEKIISHSVRFKVIHSDITCDFDSNVQNIEKRIKKMGVKKFLEENQQFSERDIYGVVHIVDLDGAFAPDEIVVENNVDRASYYEDRIEIQVGKIDDFKATRQNKRNILSHLAEIDKIKIPNGLIVPYAVYYMSSNLDHVLHNKMNSTFQEKQNDSISFGDEYDDPEKFEAFFNCDEIKVDGTYEETWEYAKRELNSLKRGSNFWLCIDKYKS